MSGYTGEIIFTWNCRDITILFIYLPFSNVFEGSDYVVLGMKAYLGTCTHLEIFMRFHSAFLYPTTLKSVGFHFIPSLQISALSAPPSVRPSVRPSAHTNRYLFGLLNIVQMIILLDGL